MTATAVRLDSEAWASGLALGAWVLYLLGLATVVARRYHRPERPDRQAEPAGLLDHLPALTGFLVHLAALAFKAKALGRFPVGNLQESAGFLAFLLASVYVAAAASFRHTAVEAMLLALAVAFLGLSFLLPGAAAGASATLHSRWFVFHTLLSFLGVTALFAACIVSALYLLADVQLKSRRPSRMLRLLPSLVACDRTALRLLVLGFPLLTLGIVTGWLWSREAGPWRIGPKELWALTAWVLSGGLLVARSMRGLSGRKAALVSLGAAIAALGAVLGIRP